METLVKINKLYKKAFVRNRYLPPSSGVRGAEAAKFINLVKNIKIALVYITISNLVRGYRFGIIRYDHSGINRRADSHFKSRGSSVGDIPCFQNLVWVGSGPELYKTDISKFTI